MDNKNARIVLAVLLIIAFVMFAFSATVKGQAKKQEFRVDNAKGHYPIIIHSAASKLVAINGQSSIKKNPEISFNPTRGSE